MPLGDGCREPSPVYRQVLALPGFHPHACDLWSARSACVMTEITSLLGHCLQLTHTDLKPMKDGAGYGMAFLEGQASSLGTRGRARIHQGSQRFENTARKSRGMHED